MTPRIDLATAGRLLGALVLLSTLGCAAHAHPGGHGGGYGRYDDYDRHKHATEGAIVGGLAGAGIGRAIAGHRNDDAGYWIGGMLGAVTGAVIGDSMDRERDRYYDDRRHPAPRYPDGPYRHDDRDHDRWDDDDRWDRHGRHDDDRHRHRHHADRRDRDLAPRVLDLPDEVLFESGSSRLSRGDKRRLREVAKAMRRHPRTVAVVRGHAEASRRERRDHVISEARAAAVRNYLIDQGVPASRITALGMGDRFPVASNHTPEGRQRNRRAEIEVRPMDRRDYAGLW